MCRASQLLQQESSFNTGERAGGAVAAHLGSGSSVWSRCPLPCRLHPKAAALARIEPGAQYLQLPAAGERVLPGSLLPDPTGLPPAQPVLEALNTLSFRSTRTMTL